jgi:hypothetical protein
VGRIIPLITVPVKTQVSRKLKIVITPLLRAVRNVRLKDTVWPFFKTRDVGVQIKFLKIPLHYRTAIINVQDILPTAVVEDIMDTTSYKSKIQ